MTETHRECSSAHSTPQVTPQVNTDIKSAVTDKYTTSASLDKGDTTKPVENKLVKVNLIKHATEGFGFNIHGGWDKPYIGNDTGIFVTKIRRGGQAAKDGRLTVGDRIVKLNGQLLDNLSHQTVVSLFKRAGESIKLVVEKNARQKAMKEKEHLEVKRPHQNLTLKHVGIASSVLLALYVFYNRHNITEFASRAGYSLLDG